MSDSFNQRGSQFALQESGDLPPDEFLTVVEVSTLLLSILENNSTHYTPFSHRDNITGEMFNEVNDESQSIFSLLREINPVGTLFRRFDLVTMEAYSYDIYFSKTLAHSPLAWHTPWRLRTSQKSSVWDSTKVRLCRDRWYFRDYVLMPP